MDKWLEANELLPDLPDEDPWFELKFQLSELGNDIQPMLEKLQPLQSRLGLKAEARSLASTLGQVYDEVVHDSAAHAPRAVLLARHLLMDPAVPLPEWDFVHEYNHILPPEIRECSSLADTQAQVAFHLEETLLALQRVQQAVLSAIAVRGTVHEVLEHVLQQAVACEQLLKGPAQEHSRSAWHWATSYWRLMDPEAAVAEDARRATARAELAAIEAVLEAEEADNNDS